MRLNQLHSAPGATNTSNTDETAKAGNEDGRLQVHLPTVALPPAGGSEILFNSPPELELEGVIVPKFQASSRFCGSNWLARRARVDLLLVFHRNTPRLCPGALVTAHSSVTETLSKGVQSGDFQTVAGAGRLERTFS